MGDAKGTGTRRGIGLNAHPSARVPKAPRCKVPRAASAWRVGLPPHPQAFPVRQGPLVCTFVSLPVHGLGLAWGARGLIGFIAPRTWTEASRRDEVFETRGTPGGRRGAHTELGVC